MRLTTVILIASLMQVSALSFGQLITLNEKNAQLEQIFRQIRKQSGYNFYYDGKAVTPDYRVSVSVRNATVGETLKTALKGFPLTFEINENGVTIRKKEPVARASQVQTIDVRGRVVDTLGNSISGATVSVKGTNLGTTTAANGDFYIKGVPDNPVLVISFLGYITQEIKSNSEFNYVKLKQSISKLDEVQVIAYGRTTQRLNTGSVVSIKAADLEKQLVQNPLLALRGKVPGLIIAQNTGLAGGGVTIRIRGKNSLENGSDPLFIIDGVPYANSLLEGQNGGTMAGGSPLNYINLDNIESIDVLKDADATAIYGARAANGVILITTKKGTIGDTRIDVNIAQGFQQAKLYPMLNTEQYLEMRQEAFKNDNIVPNNDPSDFMAYAPDLFWDNNRYTNWQKYYSGNTGRNESYNLTLSGGQELLQFRTGAYYRNQKTIFLDNGKDRKLGLDLSLSGKSRNARFRFNTSVSFQHDINELPVADPISYSRLAPNYPSPINPDGSLNWETGFNTLANYNIRFKHEANNLILNTSLSYNIGHGFDLKGNFGYTALDIDEITKRPLTRLNPALWASGQREASFTDNHIGKWNTEPQLTYNKAFGKFNIDALLGATLTSSSSRGKRTDTRGYSSDALLNSLSAAPFSESYDNEISEYRTMAGFGRINLNYDNRFILNLTGRRDGTTRFGPGNRFSNFGAVGAAWILSEETFFKTAFPFIGFAKLRGSIGITGNDQIRDYRYLDLYEPSDTYQDVKGFTVRNLYNPNLSWESNQKMEAALELGLINDRLLLSASVYRNRPSKQLIEYSLPLITGFGGILSNWDAVIQNSGTEFSLNSKNFVSGNFKWETGFNISFQKNKLIAFPGLESSPYASRYIVGESISIQKRFKYAGIDDQAGVYQFYTADGQITKTPSFDKDRIAVFDNQPSFFGGLTNSMSFKNFNLSFTIDLVSQKADYMSGTVGGANNNVPIEMLDRWQKPGDQAKFQRYTTTFGEAFTAQEYAGLSDFGYTDASYAKLRNIALSYQFNETLIKKLKLKGLSIYMNMENVFTLSSFPGRDPESQSMYATPPLFTVSGGVKISL